MSLNHHHSIPALQAASSLSAQSSSSSAPTTTQANANTGVTLEDCFISVGLSPPSKASFISMSDVQKRMSSLLCPFFQWNSLSDFQQAKMAFLVLRGQPDLLRTHKYKGEQTNVSKPHSIAQDLWNAVTKTDSVSFKRLEGFVRKGGDKNLTLATAEQEGKKIPDFLGVFVKKHGADWSDCKKAPTIFNRPDEFSRVKPLLRFQEDTSTVCFLVAVASTFFYSMCFQTGTRHEEAVEHYALNINRFMRNNCSNLEIFGNIFREEGGDPRNALERLLRPFNENVDVLDMIKIVEIDFSNDENCALGAFVTIKKALAKYGALIVERFKIFPDFCYSDAVCFHGNYIEKEHFDETKINIHHSVLVVGARLLKDSASSMGGLELLIQNSWECKPFVTVGHDLLLSMGMKELVAVGQNLKFSSGSNDFDHATHVIQSGSPHHSAVRLQGSELDPLVWSLDKEYDDSASTAETTADTMPSYYDKIDPSNTAYIMS